VRRRSVLNRLLSLFDCAIATFRNSSTTHRYRQADPGEGTCDERHCNLRAGCSERLARRQHCDRGRGCDLGRALAPCTAHLDNSRGLMALAAALVAVEPAVPRQDGAFLKARGEYIFRRGP
jgi:hypothetical protein